MLQYVLIPDHEDLMFLQPVAGLEEVARGGWSEVYINPVPISLHPQKSNFYEVGISTFNTLSTSSLPIVLPPYQFSQGSSLEMPFIFQEYRMTSVDDPSNASTSS
jgi:hypothetical protein